MQFQATFIQLAEKPPPLFCLLVRYSARIVWCDITLPNHTSCIIKHPIGELAETPPPIGKFFLDWIYPFHAISSNFHSAGRKAPPHMEFFLDWIYPFYAISNNFCSAGRKATPLFCLFMRDLTRVTHVEYPWSPYYKSALRFLLSKYLL